MTDLDWLSMIMTGGRVRNAAELSATINALEAFCRAVSAPRPAGGVVFGESATHADGVPVAPCELRTPPHPHLLTADGSSCVHCARTGDYVRAVAGAEKLLDIAFANRPLQLPAAVAATRVAVAPGAAITCIGCGSPDCKPGYSMCQTCRLDSERRMLG